VAKVLQRAVLPRLQLQVALRLQLKDQVPQVASQASVDSQVSEEELQEPASQASAHQKKPNRKALQRRVPLRKVDSQDSEDSEALADSAAVTQAASATLEREASKVERGPSKVERGPSKVERGPSKVEREARVLLQLTTMTTMTPQADYSVDYSAASVDLVMITMTAHLASAGLADSEREANRAAVVRDSVGLADSVDSAIETTS